MHSIIQSIITNTTSCLMERRHLGMLKSTRKTQNDPPALPCSRLLPATQLVSARYNWPERDFSPNNCVLHEFGSEPWLSREAGDAAVDFSLRDPDDRQYHLSELLRTAPVVLTFGQRTCPAYRTSHLTQKELAQTFHQSVHFVHVYSIEPHPRGSNAPDTGKLWELMYSDEKQPATYDERRDQARKLIADHPNQIVLIDDLDPSGLINPIWSTYGPAPRPAFLIRQDGIIHTSQLWFTPRHLSAAIQQLKKLS